MGGARALFNIVVGGVFFVVGLVVMLIGLWPLGIILMLVGGLSASSASRLHGEERRHQQLLAAQCGAPGAAQANEQQRQVALLQLAAVGQLPAGLEVVACGHVIKRGATFCTLCGAAVKVAVEQEN